MRGKASRENATNEASQICFFLQSPETSPRVILHVLAMTELYGHPYLQGKLRSEYFKNTLGQYYLWDFISNMRVGSRICK